MKRCLLYSVGLVGAWALLMGGCAGVQADMLPPEETAAEWMAARGCVTDGSREDLGVIKGETRQRVEEIIAAYPVSRRREMGEAPEAASTVIRVGAAYDGRYLELTLTPGHGKAYALTVSPEDWQRLSEALRSSGEGK